MFTFGGVGIGGVLEPLQAAPVIIEDGAFIGSRCIVVEGVHVGKEVVLGANVCLTGSTKLLLMLQVMNQLNIKELSCSFSCNSRSYTEKIPSWDYQVPCAIIIGQRKPSTDLKTSLNDALREYNVAV